MKELSSTFSETELTSTFSETSETRGCRKGEEEKEHVADDMADDHRDGARGR